MMMNMRFILALLLAIGVCISVAAEKDMLVVVDPSHPSYTVLVTVPADKRTEIQQRHPAAQSLSFVPLAAFQNDPKRYVSERILVTSYSTPQFYDRLGQLMAKYPGTPVGVAFNGGIVITYNDHMHTDHMYEIWKQDKEKYLEIQSLPENLPRDPINPEAHFGSLLGPIKQTN